MSQQKFKNSPEVRAFLAKQQREYRERVKNKKQKASVGADQADHTSQPQTTIKEALAVE
jgi:hypothetical protein